MSLVEELVKELEHSPEKARKLLEKIIELYPELSLSLQMRELVRQMRTLAEEQTKIWQSIEELKREQTKIWQEIKAIKEEQTKIWQSIEELKREQTKMREDFNEMLATIKDMQIQQRRLERRMDRIYEGLSASIMYAFGELSRFAGMTFEEFVRRFLTDRMRRAGEISKDKELRSATIEGEEIDLFLEDPLIVGEVTAHAKSAEEEMEKLLRKVKKVRELYRKEPRKLLIVETASKVVSRRLEELAEEEGVELVIGRVY